MGFEEMVVAIIGTIAGVGFLGFVFARITSLIQSWINRKKGGYDEETFNRLAKAFIQHKKDTERRLQNLEAIISEDQPGEESSKQLSEPKQTIEIEENEQQDETKNQSDDKLKNMLKN